MKTLFSLLTVASLATGALLSSKAHAIFLGEIAAENQFPASIAIMIPDAEESEGLSHHCTGARIGTRFIMTAAHCFYKPSFDGVAAATLHPAFIPGKKFVISSGVQLWKRSPDYKSKRFNLTVKKIYIHPSYKVEYLNESLSSPFNFTDLAILEVAETKLSDSIPLAKVDFTEVSKKDKLTIAGFGVVWEKGMPEFLKFAPTKFQNLAGGMIVLEAGVAMAGMAPASIMTGDSGGPLYSMKADGLNVVGINSRLGFRTQFMTRIDKSAPGNVSEWLKQFLK